jgi:hypothetical protein
LVLQGEEYTDYEEERFAEVLPQKRQEGVLGGIPFKPMEFLMFNGEY